MNTKLRLREKLDSGKETLLQYKELICLCFAAVFFWGLLAHGYGFLHSSLSHDVLNAFVASPAEDAWKIQLGRFFVPLYRAVFRGAVHTPWLIGFLGLLWTAIGVFLVVRIFHIRSRFLTVLVAGIMTTNITCIAQIATYAYEYDFNCLAMLLSVLAVLLWDRDRGMLSVLGGGVCVLLSIGIYQGYLPVTVTLILWKCIADLMDGKEVRAVFFHGLRGIAVLLVGAALYLAAEKLIFGLTGLAGQSRTDALDWGAQGAIRTYLNLLIPAMTYLAGNICHTAYRSVFFILAVGVLSLLLAAFAVRLFRVKKFSPDRALLTLFLVFLLPFAMTCVYFLAKGVEVHDLTKYGIWFFYIIMLLFSFRLCDGDMLPGTASRALRAAVCVLAASILWQNVVLANTAYVKKEMEANAALSTMTRAVSMLEQQEEYMPGETPLAFIGTAQQEMLPGGSLRVSEITGLERSAAIPLDSSSHYYNAYKAYLAYVMQYPAQFCSDETHARLKADPRVLALPSFPHRDCMAMIDGVMVIKMGPQGTC